MHLLIIIVIIVVMMHLLQLWKLILDCIDCCILFLKEQLTSSSVTGGRERSWQTVFVFVYMYVTQTYVYLCICWPQREAEEPPGGLRSSTQNNLGFRENDRRAPASSFCKLIVQLICFYVCCSTNMVLCVSANDLRRPSLAQERQRRKGHSSSSSFLYHYLANIFTT